MTALEHVFVELCRTSDPDTYETLLIDQYESVILKNGYNLTEGGGYQGSQASRYFWDVVYPSWTDKQRLEYSQKIKGDVNTSRLKSEATKKKWTDNYDRELANAQRSIKLATKEHLRLIEEDPIYRNAFQERVSNQSKMNWQIEEYREKVLAGIDAYWDDVARLQAAEHSKKSATDQWANYSDEKRVEVRHNIGKARARISDKDVWRIRFGDLRSMKNKDLAEMFGICTGPMSVIRNSKRNSYSWITEELFANENV